MNPDEREKLTKEILTALRFGPLQIGDVLMQCPSAKSHPRGEVKDLMVALRLKGQVESKVHFNKNGQRRVWVLHGWGGA